MAKDPGHADALHYLGVILYQCGRIEPAIELLERALPTLSGLPDFQVNYGNALRQVGRQAEAAERYRRATALDPGHGMAHNNLARVLIDRGAFEAGLDSARRALELIPDLAAGHLNYAEALMGLDRFADAEVPLRRALTLIPERSETYKELGRVLGRLARFDEAVEMHQRAIALKPNDADMHYALGVTLYRANNPTASEASFRQALSLLPESASAWSGLGNALQAAGRFEEARSCFRRALELAPDRPGTHLRLAFAGDLTEDEAKVEHLKSALNNRQYPPLDRVAAGFAAGLLLDGADRFDEAFTCFAEANALRHQQLADAGSRFDLAELRRSVDLLSGISTDLYSVLASWGNPSELPVFIVGMPRSGTSLVEQIAASHSRVFGAGERREIKHLTEAVIAHNRGRNLAEGDAGFARQLADRHLAHIQALGGGAERVIDKMPDNILFLWVVAALFPSARIILCQRDLRDVCLSCYFTLFDEEHHYTYDLAECGLRALEIERLATHWLRVLPVEILVIDYEELVTDLEGESRRLIEFLGLEWEPACLDFHKTERPVFTASSWQVRQPIYSRSVGRWRKYEKHLGPLLNVLA